jgi:hypothetical protein
VNREIFAALKVANFSVFESAAPITFHICYKTLMENVLKLKFHAI